MCIFSGAPFSFSSWVVGRLFAVSRARASFLTQKDFPGISPQKEVEGPSLHSVPQNHFRVKCLFSLFVVFRVSFLKNLDFIRFFLVYTKKPCKSKVFGVLGERRALYF